MYEFCYLKLTQIKAKLLLGKIRIGQGAVLMKKKMFSNAAERFVEAANLVLDQKRILNFKMYREICFQIASCLQEMDAPELGIEYVKRGQNIPLEEVHLLLILVIHSFRVIMKNK